MFADLVRVGAYHHGDIFIGFYRRPDSGSFSVHLHVSGYPNSIHSFKDYHGAARYYDFLLESVDGGIYDEDVTYI